MPLTKIQKQKIIEDLTEKIEQQKIMIFVDFTSLKVKDLLGLRKKLKSANSELKVTKKTLTDIAFQKAKIEMKTKKLSGQIALIFGYRDETSPAKLVFQFSQENPKLKILGGIWERKFLEKERIIEIAELPTKEELLARLAGSISAPISNFIHLLRENLRNFVFLLSQITQLKVSKK